jgi:spore germination cell wall hydrolase CwlJ-like protein
MYSYFALFWCKQRSKVILKTANLIKLTLTAFLCVFHVSAYAADFDNTGGFDFTVNSPGQELGCLAMNIYFEGRGESARGRAAIASVTMNRVQSKRYPNTICEVVWQRKQFSWTTISPRHHVINDTKAWSQALLVAKLFVNGAQISLVGDATHYHSVSVQPSWQDASKLVALVGDHYFYSL